MHKINRNRYRTGSVTSIRPGLSVCRSASLLLGRSVCPNFLKGGGALLYVIYADLSIVGVSQCYGAGNNQLVRLNMKGIRGDVQRNSKGEERILRKINCLCEIFKKNVQKGGRRRTIAPLCTPMKGIKHLLKKMIIVLQV